MKLFVNKNDHINVKVYCWEDAGETNASHQLEDAGTFKTEIIEFIFRKPNHQDSSNIMRQSLTGKLEGAEMLNIPAFQDQLLRTLIHDWTIVDEDGKKVPVNMSNVNNLSPVVARAAVTGVLEHIKM